MNQEVIEEQKQEVETDQKLDENPVEQQESTSEVVVTIGDEEPKEDEQRAAPWVRELRKKNREDQKRIRELEEQLRRVNPESQKPILGKKPTLSDFDYDEEKLSSALDKWYETKRQIELEAEKEKTAIAEQEITWKQKLSAYAEKKEELNFNDFDDAEETITTMLNQTQQGIIIQGADNPALVVYALGKNPTKAKELGSINDPVKFAFAISKLEGQLKVTQKKTVPAPEKVITGGTASKSSSVDSNLDKLREEARKTGDMSKVLAYKKQMRKTA